jgi:hypothetical protein
MRQNATTGAPVRSEPKVGNACAYRPSSNAAIERSSAAVTTPCLPRPWIRTWITRPTAPRPLDAVGGPRPCGRSRVGMVSGTGNLGLTGSI